MNTRLKSPIELNNISHQEVKQIQSQWKQKKIILKSSRPSDTNSKHSSDEPRYESDREVHVVRETQARVTQNLPDRKKRTAPKDPLPLSQAPLKKLPKLSDLGVPFYFNTLQKSESIPTPEQKRRDREQDQESSGIQDIEQHLIDETIAYGSENLLNSSQSRFFSFYRRFFDALDPVANGAFREFAFGSRFRPDLKVVIELILNENGVFQPSRVLQSSGVRAFDDSMNNLWKKLPPMVNPPKGLLNSQRLIKIQILFYQR